MDNRRRVERTVRRTRAMSTERTCAAAAIEPRRRLHVSACGDACHNAVKRCDGVIRCIEVGRRQLGTIGLTGYLYYVIPNFFPQQDTGPERQLAAANLQDPRRAGSACGGECDIRATCAETIRCEHSATADGRFRKPGIMGGTRNASKMRGLVFVLIALMGLWSAAAEQIRDDGGGSVDTYVQRFTRARDSSERVVIDGPCLSACTLVLALVPRNRICVTPNASFGFHAAWSYDAAGGSTVNSEATRTMWTMYPPAIRAWISRHGGLGNKMIYLRGRALSAMYPACLPGR